MHMHQFCKNCKVIDKGTEVMIIYLIYLNYTGLQKLIFGLRQEWG